MEPFFFNNNPYFVKRDDLFHPMLSGNKIRKLWSLSQQPEDSLEHVVSFGGAQSNAMASLAHLCRLKGWRFSYLCKKLPKWLARQPAGNLKAALEDGMVPETCPAADFDTQVEQARQECMQEEGCLFIPRGGAMESAKAGIAELADEILRWLALSNYASATVATPSGTGTTAYFLRQFLPGHIDVLTTPVVGDAAYLQQQMRFLGEGSLPAILAQTPTTAFASVCSEYLAVYQQLLASGIEFDLIYAPKMWAELDLAYPLLRKPVVYLHSGGVGGNISQLDKYAYRGIQ